MVMNREGYFLICYDHITGFMIMKYNWAIFTLSHVM